MAPVGKANTLSTSNRKGSIKVKEAKREKMKIKRSSTKVMTKSEKELFHAMSWELKKDDPGILFVYNDANSVHAAMQCADPAAGFHGEGLPLGLALGATATGSLANMQNWLVNSFS